MFSCEVESALLFVVDVSLIESEDKLDTVTPIVLVAFGVVPVVVVVVVVVSIACVVEVSDDVVEGAVVEDEVDGDVVEEGLISVNSSQHIGQERESNIVVDGVLLFSLVIR